MVFYVVCAMCRSLVVFHLCHLYLSVSQVLLLNQQAVDLKVSAEAEDFNPMIQIIKWYPSLMSLKKCCWYIRFILGIFINYDYSDNSEWDLIGFKKWLMYAILICMRSQKNSFYEMFL
jgi:hypothetical protein